MSEEEQPTPNYEVGVWINARDNCDYPCGLHPLGFDIKAFSSDQIQVELKGIKDFSKGAWVTTEELENFAEKLMQIVERLNALPMTNTHDVSVLWNKDDEAK